MTIDYGVTTAGTTSINGGGIYTDVAAKFEIEGELTINSGFSGNGSIDKPAPARSSSMAKVPSSAGCTSRSAR